MISFTLKGTIKQYDMAGGINKSLIQSTLLVQGKAVKNAPYMSGNLRRSITTEVSKDTGVIGTNLVYAQIREYVNKKNPGRKFYMKRALESSFGQIKKIFIKNIENVLSNK